MVFPPASRRFVLTGLAATLTLPASLRLAAAQAAPTQIEIVWQVPRTQVPAIKDGLDWQGKIEADPESVQDTKGLPLIYIIAGIVTLAKLVETVIANYRDVQYGGVILDARGKALKVNNDKRIPGGTIIVIDKNGTQVLKTTQPSTGELTDLLKNLI